MKYEIRIMKYKIEGNGIDINFRNYKDIVTNLMVHR